MSNALMDSAGAWSIGHLSWSYSDINRMHRRANKYQLPIQEIDRALQPSRAPQPTAPEQLYQMGDRAW
jgi:hypothetical protein